MGAGHDDVPAPPPYDMTYTGGHTYGTDQIQPISGPVQSMGAGADSACQAT